jgi:hypothetical protein
MVETQNGMLEILHWSDNVHTMVTEEVDNKDKDYKQKIA